MLLAGAGQIGMAIARRTGFGKKIIVGDKKREPAEMVAKIMNEADSMRCLLRWICHPESPSEP